MKRILLLGSGELGKEFVISAQRMGCNVIACDNYINAPAMQVADEFKVFDMLDGLELRKIVDTVKPDLIIPEIEAIRTDELINLESQGHIVIPSARAVSLTMNRDAIRDRVVELGIKTANYLYANSEAELKVAVNKIGLPCIIKPVMSSSGKGQIMINNQKEIETAWEYATKKMRGDRNKVIVEELINFDSEITLLTIKQKEGSTLFCPPIGHTQQEGDYLESWQPVSMNKDLLKKAEEISKIVTNDLGGFGLFGVEFFLLKEEVIFSELSPRPHDTGMVTLFTQNLSEFDLHLRAAIGIPIPNILLLRRGYSTVIKAPNTFKKNTKYNIEGLEKALKINNTDIRLFGKEHAWPGRRLGIILASDEDNAKAVKRFITVEGKS